MDYIDRNGNITHVSTKQDRFLQGLYGSLLGRCLVFILIRAFISKVAGVFMNSRLSALMIRSFIEKNSIPMNDYEPCAYSSYNDFFTRKIKAEKRPFSRSPNVLISPSDGKALAYPIQKHSVFQIKHTSYTVESLLKNKALAEEFAGGCCVIIRLTVDNYHRYCYVADGDKGDNIAISGVFHTVNPVAVQHVPVFKENSREYTVLQSTNFGKIIQMEVGAMMVGKISNYHQEKSVHKGQEKGYFEFGGSSIILLLQKGSVQVAEDLLRNTEAGFETYIKMGDRLADAISLAN